MIRHLRHTEIDTQKWDDCISNSINGYIYAFSWYLNASCEQWDALIEDDYRTVMPLPWRSKFGIKYLYPPSFTQQLGIFSPRPLSDNNVNEFLLNIPNSFSYIDLKLNSDNQFNLDSYKKTQHINLQLNLKDEYEVIKSKYTENTRRNIQKAELSGISIEKYPDAELLIEIFRQNKARQIKKLPADYYEVAEKIFKSLLIKNKAEIYVAYFHGQICSGILWAMSCNKATLLFSASNESATQHRAMFALIDNFIKTHAGNSLILDFEGSDNINLARFYRGFGGAENNYFSVSSNKLPAIIRAAVNIKKKFL